MRPPRKWLRRLAILGVVGSTAATLATLILLRSHPKPEVTVVLLGYTNGSGGRLALFQGTNGSSRPISYHVSIETNYLGRAGCPVLLAVHKGGLIAAGQTFTFTLTPPKDLNNWHVAFFYRLTWTRWQHVRYSCGEFLHTIGWDEIAESMDPGTTEGRIWLNCERAPECWVNHYGFGD